MTRITLIIRRVMFAVEDIDAVVARMLALRALLIGEMQYDDTYRLAYIRVPVGIIVALAEQLGKQAHLDHSNYLDCSSAGFSFR